jgi:hypothetical protein
MRMPIGSAWFGLRPNSEEPQSPQNHFSPPLSGFHTRSLSSPAMIRKVSGAGWAFADAAAPLRRWQRLQWPVAREQQRRGHLEPDGPAVAATREREVGHRQLYLLMRSRRARTLRTLSPRSRPGKRSANQQRATREQPTLLRCPREPRERSPHASSRCGSLASDMGQASHNPRTPRRGQQPPHYGGAFRCLPRWK